MAFAASVVALLTVAYATDLDYSCSYTGSQANDIRYNSSTCGQIRGISCPWGLGTGHHGTPICDTCRDACYIDASDVYVCWHAGTAIGCAPRTRRCNDWLTVTTCPCWGSGEFCPCLILSSSCFSTSCIDGDPYQFDCTLWY